MGIRDRLISVVTHDPEPDEGTFPLPVDEYTIPDNDDNNAANKRPGDPPPSMLEPKTVVPKPKRRRK